MKPEQTPPPENHDKLLFPAGISATRSVLWIAIVALIYFAAARLSLLLVVQPEGIAAVWPPGGIFLSAILLTRHNLRPPLVAVLCVTDLIAELLAGTPFLVSAIYALALSGDAVLSSWLLIRFAGEPIAFRKARDVVGFLAFAFIFSNGLTSLVAAAAATLIPGTSFWNSWKWWAASDGIGNLLVTPFILSWAFWVKTRLGTWNAKQTLECAVLFILLALLHIVALGYLPKSELLSLFLPYLTFPLLLWAALRFGVRGVTSALLLLAAISIPFAAEDSLADFFFHGSHLDAVMAIQLYLAIMAIPSLFLASVVTEREMAEDRFRAIFEQAAVGVAQVETATGRFVQVNRRYCEIVGLTPDQMAATDFMTITHPEDLQADMADMEQLKQDRFRSYSKEKRYLRPDGSLVWVNLTVSPMWAPGEKVNTHIAVVEDITARRQAEEGLRESEARYRTLFEDAPIALWEEDFTGIKARFNELHRSGVTDIRVYLDENPEEVANLAARVRIVQINRTSVRVFGAESKEQVTRELPRYFTAESLEVFKEEVIALAEGRTRFNSEALRLTVGGRPVVFDLTLSVQPRTREQPFPCPGIIHRHHRAQPDGGDAPGNGTDTSKPSWKTRPSALP